jgi:drug/metabolite transporter (DMT)-like permease
MYALASVLQQRGAAAQPEQVSLRLGLLVRLLHNRGWVLGVLADGGAFVLQFIALGHGPIVVVQSLLVCGLLFALPIEAAWSKRSMPAIDWLWAFMVCAGLAAFLIVARPASGSSDVKPIVWVLLLSTDAAVALALIGASFGRSKRRRALLLSTAAGVLYGAAAALTKSTAHLLDQRLWHLLLHWQPYALIVIGVAGMVVAQSAFQAGALDVSLPAMSVVDPVVSIAIGAFAFGESLAINAGAITVQVIALIVMSVGVVFLARAEATERLVESPGEAHADA